MRRLLLVPALAFLVVAFVSPGVAHADHSCRVEARKLQPDIVSVADLDELTVIIQDAIADHPECKPEFGTLIAWHAAGDESVEFPFVAADDPRHNFLGPVGWWWNTVYRDWMGGSGFMMFMFGWEIFLIPIVLVIGLGNAVVAGISSGLASAAARGRDA